MTYSGKQNFRFCGISTLRNENFDELKVTERQGKRKQFCPNQGIE